jgi:hypothetical protein
MVAVPAVTAPTVNVALEAPAWIVTDVCTVATVGLLLDSATLAPAVGAAAVRLTVPCPLLPAARSVAFSATLDTASVVVVGPVDESDPLHRIMATVATAAVTNVTNGVARRLILKRPLAGEHSAPSAMRTHTQRPSRRRRRGAPPCAHDCRASSTAQVSTMVPRSQPRHSARA